MVKSINYMHEVHGLVHRDLSSNNIVYNYEDTNFKILDFGYTGLAQRELHSKLGTAHYTAPEIIRGEK